MRNIEKDTPGAVDNMIGWCFDKLFEKVGKYKWILLITIIIILVTNHMLIS
jgi:hypothetical protein